jgi:hypothetical protein
LLCDYHDKEDELGYIDHPDVWDVKVHAPNKYELRHLYDLFDQNDIYITICTLSDFGMHFSYGIEVLYSDHGFCVCSDMYYDSRSLAEIEAFAVAFESLEEKIRVETKLK